MCNLDTFVQHIRGCRISDEIDSGDGIVWSDDEIRKCVEESVRAIYSLRGDLFAEKKTFTLKSGQCLLDVCGDCSSVADILTADNKSCNEIEEKNDEDTRSLEFLACYFDDCSTPDCVGGNSVKDGYDPVSYKRYESTPCLIRFEKPAPSDRDIAVHLMCVPKNPLSGDTLPDKICNDFFTSIIDLTFSRLFLIDHKDAYSVERSDRHYKLFSDLFTLKLGMDFSLIDEDWLLNRQRR